MPVAWYRYDALGRRIEKQVMSGPTERYVFSGLETIQVYDGGGAWKQDFVYGEGIDHILMLQQPDLLDHDGDQDTNELARHYYHRNALGSVMEITDPLQAVAVSYRYDPYGNATITRGGQVQSSDPLGQHVAFTARWLDEETGLYYYRARMYSADSGRFLQRDPLGYRPGPNVYGYVRSQPTRLTDPLGLAPAPLRDQTDKLHFGEQSKKLQRSILPSHANETVKTHDVQTTVNYAFGTVCCEIPVATPGPRRRDGLTCRSGREGKRMCMEYTVFVTYVITISATKTFSIGTHYERPEATVKLGDVLAVGLAGTGLAFGIAAVETGSLVAEGVSVGLGVVDSAPRLAVSLSRALGQRHSYRRLPAHSRTSPGLNWRPRTSRSEWPNHRS